MSVMKEQPVVSYRNSTSNHNSFRPSLLRWLVVSYRNSTSNHNLLLFRGMYVLLYLIEILHQTTTTRHFCFRVTSCILSKFYIKPQQRFEIDIPNPVVSYRNSTSNHNLQLYHPEMRTVVSYRNSTSNHNYRGKKRVIIALYLIEILHQTTT